MILLTTSYSVTGPTGLNLASSPHATAMSSTYTWANNTAAITFAFGTATVSGSLNTGFTISSSAPMVTLTLNLTTGVWQAGITNGPFLSNGTLTGSQLTSAISVYTGPATALRDAADYFASTTFLPGTQPALWGAGDL
jgi:hypothetical protein